MIARMPGVTNRQRLAAGAALLLGALLLAGHLGRVGERPRTLGVREGRLAPCPPSPNCLSSQADPTDALHYMTPLRFQGSPAEVQQRLAALLRRSVGATLVAEGPDYLHAEFKVPLVPFVDDVEFLLDEQAGLIHLRSASRVGQGDLGVNRRRVQSLRQRWESMLSDE